MNKKIGTLIEDNWTQVTSNLQSKWPTLSNLEVASLKGYTSLVNILRNKLNLSPQEINAQLTAFLYEFRLTPLNIKLNSLKKALIQIASFNSIKLDQQIIVSRQNANPEIRRSLLIKKKYLPLVIWSILTGILFKIL